MDYDKLLTELYDGSHPQNQNWKAATAIETIRAENEKLRAELEQARESLDFARTKDAEIIRLGADLARVTAERDAAVKQLRGYCPACKN